MSVFEENFVSCGDRLKKAREFLKFSQGDIADAAKITVRAYVNYEKGNREISQHVLNVLANNGINIDWILSNEVPMLLRLRDRIKFAREAGGIKLEQAAALVGVPSETFAAWENGSIAPDSQTLERLASVISTSVDYLDGKTNNLVLGFNDNEDLTSEDMTQGEADALAARLKAQRGL